MAARGADVNMSRLPFEDVRTLSFSQALAGNTCATLLAELGADLIKIESRKRPDPGRPRRWPDHPPTLEPTGVETNAQFGGTARSAKGITLDMSSPRGRELFKRLVAVSDIVVENFSATVMSRWGLDYEALCRVKPDIIMLSMPGLGKTGPKREYVTYGGIISAFTGLTHLWQYASANHNDYVAAAHGAFALLMGLEHRDRTGEGLAIDLAQVESGAAIMGPLYLDYLVNRREAQPSGNRVPGSAYSGVFRCKGPDCWIALELEGEEDWERFCVALGQPDLLRDSRFAIPEERARNAERLDEVTAEWTANHTAQQAMLRLQKAGLAAGVVQNGEDLYRDPQLRARRFMTEITHPDLGTIEYPQSPHRLSKSPGHARRPAPRLGEHNEYVFRGWLGLSAEELQALVDEGIV